MNLLSVDTSQERLQLVATVSLAAGVFLSDAGAAVAVLGVLGSILANRDLITLYMVLTPLSLLSDLVWLITGHPGKLAAVFAWLLLVVKAAGTWFAYDVYSSTDSGAAAADYQPFGSSTSPRRDPFDGFAPTVQQHAPVQPQQQYPSAPHTTPAPPPSQEQNPGQLL